MVDTGNKKRKVSKKTKKSWRKHIDIKDVDAFLEDKRLEERLGAPFTERKNEELFSFDREGEDNKVEENKNLTKQQRRELLKNLEPKCFALLKPLTAVPDPITKRNRVRTPEERKNALVKKKELERKLKGQLKLKEKVAIKNKLFAEKKRANKPKRGEYKTDIWEVEPTVEPPLKNEWLTNDTVRHTLANTGKKRKVVPKSVISKPSVLPAISAPHPGISYNPAYDDHQELLRELAADEIKHIKAEKHLERVTSKMFRKVTQEQKEESSLQEMSEGLPLPGQQENDNSDEDSDPTVKSINPPVKNEKKTLVQRRKQREQQKLLQEKMKQKLEKKKIADIYHLKHIGKQLSKRQKKQEALRQKRLKLKAKKILEPKVLSRHKFEPLEQEFQLAQELSGNLRNAIPTGNLLKDRYKSLQQRNVVAPGTVLLKSKKPNVKKFIKSDHKIDETKYIKK